MVVEHEGSGGLKSVLKTDMVCGMVFKMYFFSTSLLTWFAILLAQVLFEELTFEKTDCEAQVRRNGISNEVYPQSCHSFPARKLVSVITRTLYRRRTSENRRDYPNTLYHQSTPLPCSTRLYSKPLSHPLPNRFFVGQRVSPFGVAA